MKPHRTVHKKHHPEGHGHAHTDHGKATSKTEGRKVHEIPAPKTSSATISTTTADVPPSPATTTINTTAAVASTTDAADQAPDPTPAPPEAKDRRKGCACCRQGRKESERPGCCCRCCSKCMKKLCPYFPLCWNIPLMTTLQLLSVLDLFVCIGSICVWLYFHQFGPFSERIRTTGNSSVDDNGGFVFGSSTSTTHDPSNYQNVGKRPPRDSINFHPDSKFYETSTDTDKELLSKVVDKQAESVRYSKLAYLYSKFQQDVEEGCGGEYYEKNVFGHNLNITRDLFFQILYTNYLSEGASMFIDVSMILTSTAFFSKKEAKCFLMFLWIFELALIWSKIWTVIAGRSQRLCIVEYGLGPGRYGVTYLTLFFMLPVTVFRFYKWLVFTYFVHSFFTSAGVLRGEDNAQERSLRAYIQRQEELLGMDAEKEYSSSEEDNIEHL